MRLTAHIVTEQSADRRGELRRRVTLRVRITVEQGAADLIVRNISRTGLLLEGATELEVGEILDVELPHAGTCPATVVWRDGVFCGCTFKEAISPAAISAALLRSLPEYRHVHIESEGPADKTTEGAFSLRVKAAIIIGLGITSWALVGLLIWGITQLSI